MTEHRTAPEGAVPDGLPEGVLGSFDFFGFRYALVTVVAPDQAMLGVLNVHGRLTPVADVVHDGGRVCGLVTREAFKPAPADRKQRWRRECEAILTRAAAEDRL